MKAMRVLLSVLLIPLAACAAGEAGKCPEQSGADCAHRVAVPPRALPRTAERPAAPPRDLTPPPPATVGTCDPGGCWDTGGNRYNGGGNDTFLNGSGRLCQRNGVSMQCF